MCWQIPTIYVNGAGFINTPKVTLTTGVAMRGGRVFGCFCESRQNNGRFSRVDISGLSYFGILAKAELSRLHNLGQARDVTLLNDIDYQSKQLRLRTNLKKPEVALDGIFQKFGG